MRNAGSTAKKLKSAARAVRINLGKQSRLALSTPDVRNRDVRGNGFAEARTARPPSWFSIQ